MKKAKKQAVKRVLYNWRECRYDDVAMLYFVGAWTAFDDNQAAMLLGKLTKKDL